MNDLIAKWLDNPDSTLTNKELYSILDFIQDPENAHFLEQHFIQSYRLGGNESQQLSEKEMERIFLLIQSQIQEREKSKKRIDFNKLYWVFARIAAILIFPISIFALYIYFSNDISNEPVSGFVQIRNSALKVDYFSPPGARTRIFLPDSSEVWLNGKSRLSVSQYYGEGKRDVALLGEAFFSVRKDREKPFHVYTSDATLEVLGTTFNVSAYDDNACVEATLVSGEVNFIYEKEDKTSRVKIQPSEKVSLSKSDKVIVTELVDTQVYQSWKDGKIILRNHSLKQVVNILEKWFNVNINYDSNLEGYQFTATLDNKSLDQILMFISYSSPINYVFDNNTVHLTARK